VCTVKRLNEDITQKNNNNKKNHYIIIPIRKYIMRKYRFPRQKWNRQLHTHTHTTYARVLYSSFG